MHRAASACSTQRSLCALTEMCLVNGEGTTAVDTLGAVAVPSGTDRDAPERAQTMDRKQLRQRLQREIGAVLYEHILQRGHVHGMSRSSFRARCVSSARTTDKNRINPSEECHRDLKLMMRAATLLYGPRMAIAHDWWDTITFTPSVTRPGTLHPVRLLAQQVIPFENRARILLDHGPDLCVPDRFPLPSRFTISDKHERYVDGRHVLVVSGNESQSAALTLKAAGERVVTVLGVAR